MANFGPLVAEIDPVVWEYPCKFQRVSRVGFITAATSLNGSHTNFARCLAVSWAAILYIHFWRLLLPGGNLTRAKLLCVQVLRSPILVYSVTSRHSSSVRQRNFAAWHEEWNCGTFAEGATYIRLGGHHVEHRPTF